MASSFALDRMALVNAQDRPVAFFYSQKELYSGIENVVGVREYRETAEQGQQADGIFMPTPIAAITGSGQAVAVTVSGSNGRKRARILVATRLLSTALGGGQNGLLSKRIKIGGQEVDIESAIISRKAVFR